MKRLRKEGLSKRAIAKELKVSRTSVIRLLRTKNAKAYAK
jgi:transposase